MRKICISYRDNEMGVYIIDRLPMDTSENIIMETINKILDEYDIPNDMRSLLSFEAAKFCKNASSFDDFSTEYFDIMLDE